MNRRHCLKLADRIDTLLQAELGCGIDLQRMLAEPLYGRDVLLVCDAHRGHELAELARLWRAAQAEMPDEAPPSSGFGGPSSGFLPSLTDAFRPSQASSLPPETIDRAAQAELQRRSHAWYSPARWRK